MNTKSTRVALGLLAIVTITLFLLFKLSPPNESSTNKHKGSSVVEKTTSNNHSDTMGKQDNVTKNTKNTQQKNVQDSIKISECDNLAKKNNLDNKKIFDIEEIIDLANDTKKLSLALKQSATMESQIAHALITASDDRKKSVEKLKMLNSEYPDNTLLSYDLLLSCTDSESLCERSVIDDGVALESHNGAVWLLSALYELNNNNIERATEALLEASSAPVYDEYWGEHFSLFELAFSQTGTGNDLPTQVAAMSYISSAPLPGYGVLVEFCKNTELSRADILDACLRTGERLSNAKGTLITHAIGLALQKAIYRKYSDDAQVSRISNMRKEFDRIRNLSNKANSLVWQSSQRTTYWIQQIKDFGEVGATEYIVDNAIRLSSDPNFDPCEINW